MLYTGATLLVYLLLDLRHLLADGGFVNGHLDAFVVVCDHDGCERTLLRMDLLVIHTPEAVPVEHLDEPLYCRHHVTHGLVLHDVVDAEQVATWEQLVQGVFLPLVGVARHECAHLGGAVHQG